MKILQSCENKNGPSRRGEGLNDAPALKKAYVEIPRLLRLTKRMMTTIKCNLTFSMALNLIAIILAATGILNPVVGALVHNAGSVAVIVNSAFLLNWKKGRLLHRPNQ